MHKHFFFIQVMLFLVSPQSAMNYDSKLLALYAQLRGALKGPTIRDSHENVNRLASPHHGNVGLL